MFFTNATFFRFPVTLLPAFEALETHLAENALKPVGPNELERHGFVSPFGADGQVLHHKVGDALWLSLGTEFRVLPPGVVDRAVQEKVRAQEKATGQAPGGRARRRLKEEVVQELLPRAFVQSRRLDACILLSEGLVVVDTASRKAAENVISQLRHAMGGFPALPVNPERSTRMVLTGWLAGETLPAGLELSEECELKDAATNGAVIRCQRQELRGDEVAKHLESGKQCTRVGVRFHEHVSAVVDESVSVRKIKFLDGALEQLDGTHESMAQELDARFVLFTGEIRKVFAALSTAFAISSAEPLFEKAEA